jgi:hypothetical protein
MNKTDSILLRYIIKDERYKDRTAHDLKVTRANMINSGTATKYDLACIQYWIMYKEGRLPWASNSN